jgi:hypothetical protein
MMALTWLEISWSISPARIDGGRQIIRHHHGAREHLLHQFRNDVLGALVLCAGLGDLALLHDLVEQADGVRQILLRLRLLAPSLAGLAWSSSHFPVVAPSFAACRCCSAHR